MTLGMRPCMTAQVWFQTPRHPRDFGRWACRRGSGDQVGLTGIGRNGRYLEFQRPLRSNRDRRVRVVCGGSRHGMTIGGTGTMLYPAAGGLARQAARVAGSMLRQTAAPRFLCAEHRYISALIFSDAAITAAHDAAE